MREPREYDEMPRLTREEWSALERHWPDVEGAVSELARGDDGCKRCGCRDFSADTDECQRCGAIEIDLPRRIAFGGGGVPVSARCGPCSCTEPWQCLILPPPVAPKPEPLYRIVWATTAERHASEPMTWRLVLRCVRYVHTRAALTPWRAVAVERVSRP